MGIVDRKKDEIYMRMALEEAQRAGQQGEIPIGAILVKGDQVLARDHNRCIELNDPRPMRRSSSYGEGERRWVIIALTIP